MSKIFAIDYGTKKTGFAISDETKTIALPFLVLENKNDKSLAREIKKICQENDVGKIVVGIPKSLAGVEEVQAKKVREFVKILNKTMNLPIVFEDERLTSKMAQYFSEKDKKKDDKIAAQILLQGYLDRAE
jgi:putative Holliday junction resolvase